MSISVVFAVREGFLNFPIRDVCSVLRQTFERQYLVLRLPESPNSCIFGIGV